MQATLKLLLPVSASVFRFTFDIAGARSHPRLSLLLTVCFLVSSPLGAASLCRSFYLERCLQKSALHLWGISQNVSGFSGFKGFIHLMGMFTTKTNIWGSSFRRLKKKQKKLLQQRAATRWAGLFPDSDVSAPFVVYIQTNTFPSLCFPCWLTDQIKPDRTPKAASFQSGILVCIIHSCLCYCLFFFFFCRPLWIQEAERQIGCFFSISFLGPCTFARPIEGRARSLVPTFPLLSFALHALSFCLFLLKFLYFEKGYFSRSKNIFWVHFHSADPTECICLKT